MIIKNIQSSYLEEVTQEELRLVMVARCKSMAAIFAFQILIILG